jgi:hypothetical protein
MRLGRLIDRCAGHVNRSDNLLALRWSPAASLRPLLLLRSWAFPPWTEALGVSLFATGPCPPKIPPTLFRWKTRCNDATGCTPEPYSGVGCSSLSADGNNLVQRFAGRSQTRLPAPFSIDAAGRDAPANRTTSADVPDCNSPSPWGHGSGSRTGWSRYTPR